MKDSKIEWTHHTFNPWWGCTRVSPGCEHCYAETFAKRTGLGWGPRAERRFFTDKHWAEPARWNRDAERAGERRRVFCASMADVFEDRPELVAPRARVLELVEATPWLDWLLLTKRPENAAGMVPEGWRAAWPENVVAMTTAEDQRRADERIPHLVALPAARRGLSIEPLLEGVDLRPWLERLSWVIVGGESGPGARPMHPDWARSLRDQCKAAGVPFLFKQWGEWLPETQGANMLGTERSPLHFWQPNSVLATDISVRVGKKAAGRLLDGLEYSMFPGDRWLEPRRDVPPAGDTEGERFLRNLETWR